MGMVKSAACQRLTDNVSVHNIAEPFGRSSNGKTADSGSAYRGSTPCLPVNKTKDLRGQLWPRFPF
jgi:hypothetical protein